MYAEIGAEPLHLPAGLHFLGQQAVVNERIEGGSNTRFPPKTHHGTVPVLQLRRSASDYLLVHRWVAYLLAADNVSGPLPIPLREVNQPVSLTRNRFSRRLLACI